MIDVPNPFSAYEVIIWPVFATGSLVDVDVAQMRASAAELWRAENEMSLVNYSYRRSLHHMHNVCSHTSPVFLSTLGSASYLLARA